MARGETPLPAEKVDVRVRLGLVDLEDAPLVRRLVRVEFRMHGKQQWIYWYWAPEAPKAGEDLDALDCGYSGRRIADQGFTRAGA